MAARNSITREGDHSGHIIHRNEGEEGVGGSNIEEAEDRDVSQGDEDPGERWFR